MSFFKKQFSLIFFLSSVAAACYVSLCQSPHWVESQLRYQTYLTDSGQTVYKAAGKEIVIDQVVDYQQSPLRQSALAQLSGPPAVLQQWVWLPAASDKPSAPAEPVLLKADFHFGLWSLLPAFVAIALCLLTREPLMALSGGIIVGALMLGKYDVLNQVLIPTLGTSNAASILVLYLWLLGGLMGLYARVY